MCISSFGSNLKVPLQSYHGEVMDLFQPCHHLDNEIVQIVKRIFVALIVPFAYLLLSIPYGIGAVLECISPAKHIWAPVPAPVPAPAPYSPPYSPPIYAAPYVPPVYVPPIVALPVAPAPIVPPYIAPNAPDKNPDAAMVRAGRDLELGIEHLKQTGESWWKEGAVNLIRDARVDSHEDEYTRLWCAGLLNPSEDEKIDQALAQVNTGANRLHENKQKALTVKVLLGQAMEIQRIYKDTHHVFLHAQQSKWVIFTYLFKEIAKKAIPGLDLHQYKYLRVPSPEAQQVEQPSASLASWSPYGNLYSQPAVFNDARKYARQAQVNDAFGVVRDELLSVDAYFYNFATFESSLHFLANNNNITNADSLLRDVVKLGIRYFYPTMSAAALENYANQAAAIQVQPSPCGNLFVICTPKARAEEFHYRSHPFGTPCTCHPVARSPEIIDRLQEGILDGTTKCVSGHVNPQFRVYAPLLSPNTENRQHKIYLLTPFTKAYRKALKAQVRALATLIHGSVPRARAV